MSRFSLILCALLSLAAAENCFYNDKLTYVYSMDDTEQQFTDVREYKLDANATCDFLVHSNSKITFYSDMVKVRYHEYFDKDNELGCRLPELKED